MQQLLLAIRGLELPLLAGQGQQGSALHQQVQLEAPPSGVERHHLQLRWRAQAALRRLRVQLLMPALPLVGRHHLMWVLPG